MLARHALLSVMLTLPPFACAEDGASEPTPHPTPSGQNPLTGFKVDWLAEMGYALFPLVFLLGCLVIRLVWGCCAGIFGWGNRGRPPKRVIEELLTQELATTSGPFDWVIEGLTGRAAADNGTSMDDLLQGISNGSAWVEQWDENFGAWYFWNSETGEVRLKAAASVSALTLGASRAFAVPSPRVLMPPVAHCPDLLGATGGVPQRRRDG